jgi:hypothetical protein
MNEITRFDEEGNITKEWLEYVQNLDREDLETFFIGADALIRRVTKYIEEHKNAVNAEEVLNVLNFGDPK